VQNAGNNIPLSQQVRLFESTKVEMEAKVGPRAVSKLLSKSFFLVGAGSNDFFAFATAQAKQNRTATQSDVTAFYGSLLSNYSATITVYMTTINPSLVELYMTSGMFYIALLLNRLCPGPVNM
jgi:hypothetical protein